MPNQKCRLRESRPDWYYGLGLESLASFNVTVTKSPEVNEKLSKSGSVVCWVGRRPCCAWYRYGDITAISYYEQIFAIFTMLLGMTLLMGVVLGGWSSILTNYHTQKSVFAYRVNTIKACLVSVSVRSTTTSYSRGSQPPKRRNFRVSAGNWDHSLTDPNCWNVVVSQTGIAIPPAGLCFTDGTFFKCCPSHSTTGGRIATRIVALTPSMKKLLQSTATNLVNFGPITPDILWLAH